MKPVTEAPSTGKSWLHLDQGKNRHGLQCVQGVINLRNVDENAGSLRVLKQAHKFHDEFLQKFPPDHPKNWIKLSSEQIDWYREKKCEEYVVAPIPAGSLVLWDSRLVHSNRSTLSLDRMAVYVCPVPAAWARAESKSGVVFKKRKEAFFGARGTSHWPHSVTLFPNSKPFRRGNDAPNYSDAWTNQSNMIQNHLQQFEQFAAERNNLREAVMLVGFSSIEEYQKMKETCIPTGTKNDDGDDYNDDDGGENDSNTY